MRRPVEVQRYQYTQILSLVNMDHLLMAVEGQNMAALKVRRLSVDHLKIASISSS